MRTMLLLSLLALVACSGADGNRKKAEKTADVYGPTPLTLEGRALHEAACDHALELLVAVPEALEGYSLAELRSECMADLAEVSPAVARDRARCYLGAEDIPRLAVCGDPEQAAGPQREPQDSPAAVVPDSLVDPAGVDPLIWRVCVHLADVAMAELASQIDAGQVAGIKDVAVRACVDALKDVPKHELETVSDCLLEAGTVEEMQGCHLPTE